MFVLSDRVHDGEPGPARGEIDRVVGETGVVRNSYASQAGSIFGVTGCPKPATQNHLHKQVVGALRDSDSHAEIEFPVGT